MVLSLGRDPRRSQNRTHSRWLAVLGLAVALASATATLRATLPVTGASAVATRAAVPYVLDALAGEADAGAATFPASANGIWAVPLHGRHVVAPILTYHYIRVNPVASDRLGWALSVTPANFAMQMAYLHAAGGRTVGLGDVVKALRGGPPLPPHAVVLTFDDGYADFATAALPVLVRLGMVATEFVASGFVDRPGYLTAGQVRVVASAGMVIGAHTVDHVRLAHVSGSVARNEITASRAMLQALVGEPVDDFAYPYGDVSPAVEAMVTEAGFRDACTTMHGIVEYGLRPFEFPRVGIGGADTLSSFAQKALLPPPSMAAAVPMSPTGSVPWVGLMPSAVWMAPAAGRPSASRWTARPTRYH